MADPTKVSTHTAAFKLEPMDDEVDYIRFLVYGKPGSGKTTLAASAADVPEMQNVLLIDLEEGKMAIQNNARIKQRDNITRVRVTSYKQVAEIHKFLKAHTRLRDQGNTEKLIKLESKFSGVPEADIKEPRIYNTVILDSLSEFNQICLNELLGLSSDMDLTQAMSDGEVDVASFSEYKKNNNVIQAVVRAFRDLQMHSIYICHQTYIQDETKKMYYAPALTGKLANQVQGFMDIVGFLKVGKLAEGETQAGRRLYVQPVGNFDAKNRQASIKESFIENPVMADMWAAIRGE